MEEGKGQGGCGKSMHGKIEVGNKGEWSHSNQVQLSEPCATSLQSISAYY